MNQEQKKPFGKLFGVVSLESEEHLEGILQTMNKESSLFFMIQAINHAYRSGVYTLGEAEVISKSIRVVSKEEKSEN